MGGLRRSRRSSSSESSCYQFNGMARAHVGVRHLRLELMWTNLWISEVRSRAPRSENQRIGSRRSRPELLLQLIMEPLPPPQQEFAQFAMRYGLSLSARWWYWGSQLVWILTDVRRVRRSDGVWEVCMEFAQVPWGALHRALPTDRAELDEHALGRERFWLAVRSAPPEPGRAAPRDRTRGQSSREEYRSRSDSRSSRSRTRSRGDDSRSSSR